MNQNLCPQTILLIEQTVHISQQRRPLYLFDQEDLRQELTLHVLEAQRSYTGPADNWTDHCRTVLNQALRVIRSNHSRRRHQNRHVQLDSQHDIPFDDTLTLILGRMQKRQNRWKKDHVGEALLQAARDPHLAELIDELPAYDQIFALMLAALSKDELLQETGLSENAYTYRVRRVAATLKAKFPHLAKGRRRRRSHPNRQTTQETPNQTPAAWPQPDIQAIAQPQTTQPQQSPTELKQNRPEPEPTRIEPEHPIHQTQTPTEQTLPAANPPENQDASTELEQPEHPHNHPNPQRRAFALFNIFLRSQRPTPPIKTLPLKPEPINRSPLQPPRTALQQTALTSPPPAPTNPHHPGLLARTVALFTKIWRR